MGKQNATVNFQFHNSIAPRYIDLLYLRLESGQWYSTSELIGLLRSDGSGLKGKEIVNRNANAWSLTGLVEARTEHVGRTRSKSFRLTNFGKQLAEIYSTNQPLFYDVVHLLFYNAWYQTHDLRKAQFWLYFNACRMLWLEAPQRIDTTVLVNRLQSECQQGFPTFNPAFSTRSVTGIFPWLQAINPAFLQKSGVKESLLSARRSRCTPQLFHLATHLVYSVEHLQYGTSMAIDNRHIETICQMCLLDIEQFWGMAELTKLSIRGFDIRKGQWGTSIVLEGPPSWITPPTFILRPDYISSPEEGSNLDDELAE